MLKNKQNDQFMFKNIVSELLGLIKGLLNST